MCRQMWRYLDYIGKMLEDIAKEKITPDVLLYIMEGVLPMLKV